MELIDDEGNLFGVVNVIDAIAVVLLLVVVVAGVAAVGVLSGDDGETGTQYATIELGEQPAYVVSQLEAGDEMSPDGFDDNLTVTDVYATPSASGDGDTRLTIRAELQGTVLDVGESDDPIFEFGGDRLRSGDGLELDTAEYSASGQISSLDAEGETLNTEPEEVLLEGTMSATAANELAVGDTFEEGPHTVATVENIDTYAIGDEQYRVHLGIELDGLREGGSLTFAGQPLRLGTDLSLTSDAYTFDGEVIQRGATEIDSEPETRYGTLDLGEQPEYVIDELDTGDTMAVGDDTVTITDVHVSPASGDSGYVAVRTELAGQLVERPDRSDPVYWFGGDRLRGGDELTLDTAEYSATGALSGLDAEDETLNTEPEDVLLEGTMSATAANELAVGDTFEEGPHTVATVENIDTYAIGDEQYRVHLGIELDGLRAGGSLTVGGEPLRLGTDLSLTSDAYTFDGEVIQRGATEIDSEPETRYGTVDLGEQPEYVIDQIDAGDTMAVGDDTVTITDVHVSPSARDAGHVVVRTEFAGQLVERPDRSDPIYWFGGEHLRTGDDLELDLGEYTAGGEVTSLDDDTDTLAETETQTLLEATVSDRVVDEIEAGDTFELGEHTVATVETVQTYPIGGDEYRVHLGVSLDALERGSTTLFAGEAITVDRTLRLSTDTYDLDADVIRTGAMEPRGEAATTTVDLKLENIDPDVADGLEAGLTEVERGETLATLESVESEAAEVVLESDDGDIHLREHPTNKDVRLTASLETIETDSGLAFHGESLREDETIVLDFGTKQIEPTVVEIDPGE
ncbi:DUF4330 domain-containing protein [Halobacteria archaeon AArc-dxtr1]|nr:DUF4330 domain-containing protein [Halobacteria archaeon AArc-dxtr1]